MQSMTLRSPRPSRRPDRWTGSAPSTLASLALAALTLVPATSVWAGSEGGQGAEAPAPPTVPNGIKGDLPHDAIPQDAADLRRTREHLYGIALSTAQHDQIESWRVQDRTWWSDPGRNVDARQAMADLKDLLQSTNSRTLQNDLDGDPRLFGVKVEERVYTVGGHEEGSEEVGTPVTTETALRITVDARLRPDLFSLHEATLDLATRAAHDVAPLGPAAQKAFLLEVLGIEAAASSGSEGGKSAAPVHVDDFFLPTVALVEGLATTVETELDALYDVEHTLHLEQDGVAYNVFTQRAIDSEARRLEAELSDIAVQDYLDQLRPEIREPLLDFLTKKVLPNRLTVLEGQTAEREAYWVTKLKELYQLL